MRSAILSTLVILSFHGMATASPHLLTLQGALSGNGDQPVNIDIRLYHTPTNGTPVWTESHPGVDRSGGQFSIQIGSRTTGGIPPAALPSDAARTWIAITVDGGPELAPRLELTAAAYALNTRGIEVDTAGRVGIGTDAPQAALDIHGPANVGSYRFQQILADETCSEFGDPSDFYILLHRAYDGNSDLDEHRVCGTIIARRGDPSAWNRKAIVRIDSASAYQRNRCFVESVLEDWAPYVVTYQGDRYLALRPPVESCFNHGGITFTGNAIATTGELLLPVAANQVIDATPYAKWDPDENQNVLGRPEPTYIYSNLHLGHPLDITAPPGDDFATIRFHTANHNRVLQLSPGGNTYLHDPDTGEYRFFVANNGNVGIGTPVPAAKLDVAGEVRMWICRITGGSDLSENFDVQAGTVRPGDIVCIDPKRSGKLMKSHQAYDRRVAGVVSGAGGVNPGMRMGQDGTIADGKHPVALVGRVYVWADADANGPIAPGDRLTTSATPGHAMKVTDNARGIGAVIGKAMSPLSDGRGLVLLLVQPQ